MPPANAIETVAALNRLETEALALVMSLGDLDAPWDDPSDETVAAIVLHRQIRERAREARAKLQGAKT